MAKLSDIADIGIGYNFRREAVSFSSKGGPVSKVPVVQPRDVISFNAIDCENLETVSFAGVKDKCFLSLNEVLFSNKGDFKAVVWREKEKAIASSAFYRIWINDKNYLPEFVAVYLNSPKGKSQLNLRHNTERISTITISDIKKIDIPFISLERQRKIVDLWGLYQEEMKIVEKIQQNKKKLVDFIIKKELEE